MLGRPNAQTLPDTLRNSDKPTEWVSTPEQGISHMQTRPITLRLYQHHPPNCRGSDPTSGHPGAQKPPLGGDPPLPVWVSTWMHLANGEGSCPPLCGPDREQ
jgi:hypothetical protein